MGQFITNQNAELSELEQMFPTKSVNIWVHYQFRKIRSTAELYRIKLERNQRTVMVTTEENWQMKQSTMVERTTFIFNNELLSDVKFVVPVSTGESESKVIPAHKFVLAISSHVFFTMFYGQMAETANSIELPDCEYESLLEMFRFLYSDEVKLSESNVMQVLYLANKYMVHSLTEKCIEYLRDKLKASNVFCILSHARKFENKYLEDLCWKVIETQTEEAVTSDEFVTIERSLVESVVKTKVLNIKEVKLFKAVDRWATKESERQGITPDGDAKRRILGEEIVKAIRFPLMSDKEFASVDICILTLEEAEDMRKYYDDVLTLSLLFIQTPRIQFFHRCYRFEAGYRCGWVYPGKPDILHFIVTRPIMLHGVHHFGFFEGDKYTVSIEVKDATDGSLLGKQSGSYTSEKEENHSYYTYYGFVVRFDRPVFLVENKAYKLVSLILGPESWYGTDGQATVECQGVKFIFPTLEDITSNGTSQERGQFPALLFSLS